MKQINRAISAISLSVIFLTSGCHLKGAEQHSERLADQAATEENAAASDANDVPVSNTDARYNAKFIEIDHVDGVELTLQRDVEREDCNRSQMSVLHTLVSGSGDGWHDMYFLKPSISETLIGCSLLDQPVTETIGSKPIFIKSLRNEHSDGKVLLYIVIPEGFQLKVRKVVGTVE